MCPAMSSSYHNKGHCWTNKCGTFIGKTPQIQDMQQVEGSLWVSRNIQTGFPRITVHKCYGSVVINDLKKSYKHKQNVNAVISVNTKAVSAVTQVLALAFT